MSETTGPEPLPEPRAGSGSAGTRRLRPPPAPARPAKVVSDVASTYKRVFVKGLATILPTILTLWVLTAVYGFIEGNFASPIARVLKKQLVETERGNRFAVALFDLRRELADRVPEGPGSSERERLRQAELAQEVDRRFPSWVGFALAVIAVFVVGFFISGIVGRTLWRLIEASVQHVPFVRSVYPSAKQMVDFIFAGEEARRQWSAVVAVEYPRKGLWTIGYVTGKGLPEIEARSGEPVRAVFLPASPTSMTGYVVIAKLSEIVELDMTVDEALKFTISGGVVSPVAPVPAVAPAPSPSSPSPA